MTNAKLRKYAIEAQKEEARNYYFYKHVKQCAIDMFASYIGKTLTLREGKKLLASIQQGFPEARLYFKNEKYSRSFQFYRDSKNDCYQNLTIETMSSEKIYTREVHNALIESSCASDAHYKESTAKFNSISDLIDLHFKQQVEREDLARRQELERETFVKQTACFSADIDYILKIAQERIDNEERAAYHQKNTEEFAARNKSL